MSGYEIVKTVELSSMPNPALAKDLLERLRLATKVVVAKRKWRVPVLKEFYPKNGSLLGLNVNRGQSIMIRLREARDQFAFLPWHSLLGTLVHELTHNEIGEHSAEFYKMMETVYDEVEASSGSTGSLWGPVVPRSTYNFDGPAAKLGGGQLARTLGVQKDSVRTLAAEAALRRLGRGDAGPRTLGGESDAKNAGKTPKQLFLEAEERRRKEGCSVVKAPADTLNAPIIEEKGKPLGVPSSSSGVGSEGRSTSSKWTGTGRGVPVEGLGQQWLCLVCMEENHAVALACAWCGCAFGSTLESRFQEAVVVNSDSGGLEGREKPRDIGQGASLAIPDFPLAGLCRNTLYEVRGCACCANRRAATRLDRKGSDGDLVTPIDQARGAGSGDKAGERRPAPVISLIEEDGGAHGEALGAKRRRRDGRSAAEQRSKVPPAADVVSLID